MAQYSVYHKNNYVDKKRSHLQVNDTHFHPSNLALQTGLGTFDNRSIVIPVGKIYA